jgi:hypothetical protein
VSRWVIARESSPLDMLELIELLTNRRKFAGWDQFLEIRRNDQQWSSRVSLVRVSAGIVHPIMQIVAGNCIQIVIAGEGEDKLYIAVDGGLEGGGNTEACSEAYAEDGDSLSAGVRTPADGIVDDDHITWQHLKLSLCRDVGQDDHVSHFGKGVRDAVQIAVAIAIGSEAMDDEDGFGMTDSDGGVDAEIDRTERSGNGHVGEVDAMTEKAIVDAKWPGLGVHKAEYGCGPEHAEGIIDGKAEGQNKETG